MGFLLLFLLLTGCSSAPTETLPAVSASPLQTASVVPTLTRVTSQQYGQQEGQLSIISPLHSTQVSGGGGLRIALYLIDHNDLPLEGAIVQAELWTPAGELFASLPCIDNGNGQYLAEYIRLPLRNTGGYWHLVGKAKWNDDQQAEVEATFQANPSVSEMYQTLYGFWIDQPQIHGLGTGFYNLSQSGGLHFEDELHEDGSGYVLLDNYRYEALGVTFAALEVHWREAEYPPDGASAAVYAQSLIGSGLPHQDPDAPPMELSAQQVTFQDRPAWQVTGRTKEFYVSKAAAEYPVEWLMFTCPGSNFLWTLVISSDHESYISRLRSLQETFECPSASPDE